MEYKVGHTCVKLLSYFETFHPLKPNFAAYRKLLLFAEIKNQNLQNNSVLIMVIIINENCSYNNIHTDF